MSDIIVYGVVGALACIRLLLLLCVAFTIFGVIANGVDIEEETDMK